MYAGTLNPFGFGLVRTSDGVTYDDVITGGNGAIGNSAAMDLYVYDGELYIGTMNFFVGTSLFRTADDDTDGTKFEAVYVYGNGNSNNKYTWYMQEYNNRLYVGTFKLSGQFDLFSKADPTDPDEDWVYETTTGFDNEHHYGVRSMTLFEGRLIIGDATAQVPNALKVYEAVAV